MYNSPFLKTNAIIKYFLKGSDAICFISAIHSSNRFLYILLGKVARRPLAEFSALIAVWYFSKY
jgi:hypothetical protein